jgi:hypothetical protein
MTARRSAKAADEPKRETLSGRDLTVLGRLRRSTFVRTKDGRELRLKGPALPHDLERAPNDAVLITRPARTDAGRPYSELFVGRVVEAGSYEKLARRKNYVPRERPPGPVDGLAEARAGAPREIVRFGSAAGDGDRDVVRDIMRSRPQMLFTDGLPPIPGVVEALKLFQKKRANLRYHNGRTLVDWNQLTPYWRDRLVALYPLIDAAMAGKPLACGYEHETATLAASLDPVGVPVCDDCIRLGPRAA